MNSLYELDPKWQRLLTTGNFLGGLTVNEFVEEISRDHTLRVSSNAVFRDRETWDPKPFIRTFESTLRELKILQDEVRGRKGSLTEAVSQQELQQAQLVQQLARQLDQITAQYADLDTQLTTVTQVVAPLGDKLENAIRRKKMYSKSVELIKRYKEFSQFGQSKYIETLSGSTRWNDQIQAATLMKNLLVLAMKIETNSIQGTSDTTRAIEKYSEHLETNWLDQFNCAYRDNNFQRLNEIAMILNHFNGGINVITNFINQHEFFIDSNQIETDNANDESLLAGIKEKSLNPDHHQVVYQEQMVKTLAEIVQVVENESLIVSKVFENNFTYVLQLFIQRIFAQKLEPKIEYTLNTALSWSSLAYVRNLHGLHSLMGQFVKDLSEFFQEKLVTEDNSLVTAVEQCTSDIFVRHLFERSRYFDMERRNLESILVEKTNAFNLLHHKVIRLRSLTGRIKRNLDSGIEFSEDTNNTDGNQRAKPNSRLSQYKALLKKRLDLDSFPRFDHNDSVNDQVAGDGEQRLQGYDSNFTIDNVDAMLKCVVEAVARVMELVPNKANEYILELIEIMFMGIVGSYVDSALEVAYYEIDNADIAAATIDLSLLGYIATTTNILNYLSISMKSVFLPLLNNSPSVKKQIVELTNGNIKKCEYAINVIIERTVNVVSGKFVNALAKQKRKDFVPRTQDLLDNDTLPAVEIVSLLKSIHQQASEYLKGENFKTFLIAIGNDLYGLLLAHYGKFQVSSIGGIIVTKDIIGYLTEIDSWKIPKLLDKFATLRELANLFTVQPDLLDSLTKEGHLGDVNKNIISTYISNREDFNHENFISSVKNNFRQYTYN
ncbi:exocyst subunit SEC10 KNAG_0A02740 [Huiozyma naganishii CBS 8797]|uniref:Uncharacterized protein n=1 Tax=Huiozyma naganishii (strain ATCC MYA-139 / BCRC 22969 / CBS 8797 / KCTC 17520 / NBRC 10181 / NCYC 3082 / Yp74L-3) TaxID=1071383 RepID=J7REK6_HUIN7|nr:hypothetical protein KNAG_0A02740 [Kazachstania naganishii CBS 8797]CCK67963.1 hypothetical protein KNAG_0A02740 [Kazachstania naganishii CBS 8797]